MIRPFSLFLLAGMLTAPVLAADEAAASNETPTSASTAIAEDSPAVAFLRRVEARNGELKTVEATFTQTRRDFLDEVSSDGTFWYQAPNQFHAVYKSQHSALYWMSATELTEYSPSLKQVDIIPLGQGDEAPINQMLLGFGIKTEEILNLFDVSLLESEKKDTTRVEFISKDLNRTLNYSTIVITFDEKSADPVMVALDDGESELLIEFKKVTRNRQLDASLFQPKWPNDVEVIRHRRI